MTLFRKVFPHQSRPATEEEALNEEALRDAFNEMREAKKPFVLYPFDHAVEENDTGAETYDDDLDAALEDEQPIDASDDLDTFSQPDEFDLSALEEIQDDIGDALDEEPAPQSFDENTAGPDCVMTARPEAPDQHTQQEEMLDILNRAASKDDAALEKTGVVEAEQHFLEAGAQKTPAPRCEESEAVAFAREQMAALEMRERKPDASFEPGKTVEIDLTPSDDIDAVPAPAPGRAARRAGRAKTRLLGFHRSDDASSDPFGETQEATAKAQHEKFPVGWLVIVEGPGLGHSFSIFTGASMIGRGEDQVIRLDFGDNSISRNNHAAVAYDQEQNKFYIGHGGKSNIIRRNARPVLSTEELHHADLIRIGETTLRFVALCGSDFKWQGMENENV